jgi:transcriptional regulator with XRE-family HTH domain
MNLRSYIVEQGLTHKEFGEQVDASERAVIKWCRGERMPRRKALEKIGHVTNGAVGAEDFLNQRVA